MQQSDLKEVLPHAGGSLGSCRGGLIDEHPIQRILLSWIPLAKGQLGDCMAQVKVLVWEGNQIMYMHVALLKGFAWGKVDIASNLRIA